MKDLFADIYHPQKETLLTTARKLFDKELVKTGFRCKLDMSRSLDLILTVTMMQTHPLVLGTPKMGGLPNQDSPYTESAVLIHMMWAARGQRGIVIYPDRDFNEIPVEDAIGKVCGRVEARLMETYGKAEKLNAILARYQISETDLKDINTLLRQMSMYKDIDMNTWGHSPLNPKFLNFLAEKKNKHCEGTNA